MYNRESCQNNWDLKSILDQMAQRSTSLGVTKVIELLETESKMHQIGPVSVLSYCEW